MGIEYRVYDLSIPQRRALLFLRAGGTPAEIETRTRESLGVRGLLRQGRMTKKGLSVATKLHQRTREARAPGMSEERRGNPEAKAQGVANLRRVREYFETHLCATQVECAEFLGCRTETVNRHVKTIRDEWRQG